MEAFRPSGLHRPLQRRLTKMYSETKKSYDTVTEAPKAELAPEMSSLHRKLRIQKDRLIAWGLEWSDTAAAQPGDIDESLEREGLSNVVGSVLSNIKEILDEAERMRRSDKTAGEQSSAALSGRSEKSKLEERWATLDKPRFQDLLQDLTAAIDILYDLSRNRRSIQQGFNSKGSFSRQSTFNVEVGPFANQPLKATAESDRPGISRTVSSRVELNLRINPACLIIPQDGGRDQLPPYETIATPSNSRTMAYFRQHHTSTNPWKRDGNPTTNLPVLIEYAPFDPIYPSTGIYPSLSRLEKLADVLHDSEDILSEVRVLNLIGYFEDPDHPRLGLVYELPNTVYSGPDDAEKSLNSMKPFTLLSLLQAKPPTGTPSAVPNLEDRVRLAYRLAATFLYLHTKGITHRDVMSNNIAFFPEPRATYSSSLQDLGCNLRNPYLASFDLFSEFDSEPAPENRQPHIYRHVMDVRNQTNQKNKGYKPSFDLYGLGMILLEIGLWMPLSSFWKRTYTLPIFKTRIQSIYVKKLGAKCGTAYMRAVESCLTAVDSEALEEGSGQVPNMQWKFYCDVVKRLERCCAIDDDTQSVGAEPASVPLPMDYTPSPTPSANFPTTRTQVDQSMQTSDPIPSESITPSHQPTTQVASKPKLRVHPIKITPSQLDTWHYTLLPKLERLLGKALKDSPETFTIDLIGVGETIQSARPTIFVTCSSVGKVKGVLSRHFRYSKEDFDLKVRRGKIRRSCAKKSSRKKRGLPHRSAMTWDDDGYPVKNPFLQARPLCGASIGSYKDETHSPAASYGGVVIVDGDPYGMTVHHLLENSSDEEESDEEQDPDEVSGSESPTRSSARWPPTRNDPPFRAEEAFSAYISDLSEDEVDFDSAEEGDEGYAGSLADSDDESIMSESGDIPGVEIGQGSDYIITQPAIDDVEDNFFPNEEDKDDEHLYSHALGTVHASSGIRRWKRENITHEIDWALLKINDDRLQPYNLIQGGKRFVRNPDPDFRPSLRDPVCRQSMFKAADDLYPNQIAAVDDLGNLEVHCMGRTSGLQSGVISAAMSAVRIAGRKSPSRSWHVMGSFGMAGDSGAWVVDNDQGRVCGHILAWCYKNRWAYICPMEVLFEDIQRTLDARSVELPGHKHASRVAAARAAATAAGAAARRVVDGSEPKSTTIELPIRSRAASAGVKDEPMAASTASVSSSASSSPYAREQAAASTRESFVDAGRQVRKEGSLVSSQMARG